MGEDLYKPIADSGCSDSSSTMAFPTLVVRLGSCSNACFRSHACGYVNAGGMILTLSHRFLAVM